jgi:hypothetical protein
VFRAGKNQNAVVPVEFYQFVFEPHHTAPLQNIVKFDAFMAMRIKAITVFKRDDTEDINKKTDVCTGNAID